MSGLPVNPDLGLKVNPHGSSSYDYQELLDRGCCTACLKPLQWELNSVRGGDDRFCYVVCCDTRYYMVPDRVRVVSELEYLVNIDDETENCDDDFLKELEKLDDGMRKI